MPFFTAIASALNLMLGFVFRSIIAKFFVFFALWYVITEFVDYLTSVNFFPNATNLYQALASVSPKIWWALDLMAFDIGYLCFHF
ncbi:MAG: hypothetical protein EOO68_21825, partial [Moraxellaceae bacterium]